VRSLAFFGRDRILVAGDFPGVYLLDAAMGPHQVGASEPGSSVVAANDVSLAFGQGAGVSLFSFKLVPVRVYTGIRRPTPILLLALFGVGVPMAIYFFYGTLKNLLNKTKKAPEPEIPKREAEGPIPNALIEACVNGDCVLYAGSGLGAQAGLPTWSAFLPELDGRADESGLHNLLRARFRFAGELPEAHRLIKEIDFSTLLTTSLDNLLERAFPYSGGRVYTARDCEGVGRAAARRDFFILKPFGNLDEPETVRIGAAQCFQVMRENPAAGALIGDLFNSRVFLFVGASLEGLEQDLARLALDEPDGRRHFALVPDTGDAWKAVAGRLKEAYGIETLTYVPSSSAHPELIEFLTNLIAAIHHKTSTPEYFATGE
jgi:hypothetical protein